MANHDDSLSPNSQLNDFAPEGDADFTPDEGDANAWGLYAVGSVQAQQVDVPRAKVTVGVLDTGIDADHPDLKDQVDRTRSGLEGRPLPRHPRGRHDRRGPQRDRR